MIFETYCKEVVNALKQDIPNDMEFGFILRRCHRLLWSKPYFKVVHVRRSANEVAYAIGRWSRHVQTPAIKLECPV